jgi:hypothetical protein
MSGSGITGVLKMNNWWDENTTPSLVSEDQSDRTSSSLESLTDDKLVDALPEYIPTKHVVGVMEDFLSKKVCLQAVSEIASNEQLNMLGNEVPLSKVINVLKEFLAVEFVTAALAKLLSIKTK